MKISNWASGVALCAAALIGGACTKYTFDERLPESIKEVNRVVPAARPTPADILFVVDNSGSMADEQENLARNFDAFINEIAGQGDYQLAIVTTDMRSGMERQGLRTFTYKTTEPYSWLFSQQTDTCSATDIPNGCFRGPSASTRIIPSSMPREQQISTFQDNVRVGSCGTGEEEGLEAMVRALEQSRGNGCNAGFLREGANLVIVIVSDEEDSDFAGAPERPIANYVNALQQFKSPSQIRVATIVGSIDGEARRCGRGATCGGQCNSRPPDGSGSACQNNSQCTNGEMCQGMRCENPDLQFWQFCWWCSYYNAPDCCTANVGSRYVEFAKAMEQSITGAVSNIPVSGCRAPVGTRAACLIDSICQAEFDATLSRIARELIIDTDYVLEPPAAYPPGVVVVVNGTKLRYCGDSAAQDCDYTISSDGGRLSIFGANAPGQEDEVEIYYTVATEQ